ncbi:hypothetical protein Scep_024759 [Stephania cephalantha]|uniref:HhH-GPD domain-containing protein n=1 Tax=Stephania cephalantha TaxID=152367 RepID=A0AAP0EXW4_9MAGN
MDYGGNFPGNNEGIGSSGGWIPGTPAKPIPARVQSNLGEHTQVNKQNGGSMYDQIRFADEFFMQNAACVDAISKMAEESGINNWEASLVNNPGSLRNATIGLNNIPFSDLLALADAACAAPPNEMGVAYRNVASNPFFSSSADRNLQQPHLSCTMLMNQNNAISSMPANTSNFASQMPQYGFRLPYQRTYDLSSQETVADKELNAAFPFAPVTPDHHKQMQENQRPESANLEESATQPNSSKENNQIESTGQELAQDGIDLNKTPQQKARRRKHRPRVVKEGTEKKAPKPTVEQAGTNETPRKKRKYVRKNSIQASQTPPPDDVGEVGDKIPCATTKSCKRALNFDREEQAVDGSHDIALSRDSSWLKTKLNCEQAFDCNSESKAQEVKNNISGASGNNSTVHILTGMELMAENSPAGIAFDLNRSLTQDESISLPSLPEAPISAMRHRQLENHAVQQCQNSYSTMSSVNWYQIYQGLEYQKRTHPGLHFPEIYKKRRTEKAQNTIRVPPMAPMANKGQDAKLYRVNGNPFVSYMSCSYSAGSALKNGSSRSTENLNSQISSSIHYMQSQSTGMTCSMQGIPNKFLPQYQVQTDTNINRSQTSEFMLSLGQIERNTKKRSKGSTRVRDLNSLAALFSSSTVPSARDDRQRTKLVYRTQKRVESIPLDKQAKMAEQKDKELAIVRSVSYSDVQNISMHDHCASPHSNCQALATCTGPIEAAQHFNAHVNHLIHQLDCVNLNEARNKMPTQEENALVPYVHGQIVPYEGLFDPVKKRKPRPKVDLDPETDRVWKLLMYKEGIDADEDANKEKQWEEERRIFSGRVDSFIARMHLIQGDRRFSRWNGSVLDSVVGVFLTQNVSDHLSSSAFMALAARFPLNSTSNLRPNDNTGSVQVEELEVINIESDDVGCQGKISRGPISDQDSTTFSGAVCAEEKKTVHERDILGNTDWGSWEGISQISHISPENITDNLKVWKGYQTSNVADMETPEDLVSSRTSCVCSQSQTSRVTCREVQEDLFSSQSSCVLSQNSETSDRIVNMTLGTSSVIHLDDKRTLDEAGSSQKSVCLSQLVTDENIKSCSDSNSEGEDPTTRNNFSGYYRGLLQMACTNSLPEEFSSQGSDNLIIDLNSMCDQSQSEATESDEKTNMNQKDAVKDSFSIPLSHSQFPIVRTPDILPSNHHFNSVHDSGELKLNYHQVMGVGSNHVSTLPTNITRGDDEDRIGLIKEIRNKITTQQKLPSNSETAHPAHQHLQPTEQHVPPLSCGQQDFLEKNSISCASLQEKSDKTLSFEEIPARESSNLDASLTSHITHQERLNESNSSRESTGDVETCSEDKQRQQKNKIVVSSIKERVHESHGLSNGTTTTTLKTRARIEKEKKAAFDWDSLRREVLRNGTKRERTMDTMDSLDWEAVRCADVNEIANAIKERGMNNMLAGRIKDFLDRIVRDHGSIDLEWLRDVPPDKIKDYLLSVRGLGLKSVECVRLLTLHHLAFPVDTNVGRIAVRLGWVPLQPLPESLQLHLLEMYPILESIQKYLWPRLCTLDQRTLYELHYQMITFGKVFCTKSKPNCNACPMRAECKHFASAFASARLALPAPEQKGIVSSNVPIATSHDTFASFNPMPQRLPLPVPEAAIPFESMPRTNNHEPIIEVPASPECQDQYTTESDFEDTFYEEDPDEIPTIKLNIEDFALNLQNYMQANMELQEGDMSKALVALTPEVASIPTPKLKNVTRLRTEHQVYELPDSHPLLKGVEARVPNEVSSYLLAIWTPGETAESIQPPDRCCSSQTSYQLCNEATCFSCNSIREAKSQIVRGTLLIPCKTAMRGSFPLNGTYFQVNEVFADHESSLNPICVPRDLIWNLPRRTVYFGTSIPTIFKGQTTAEIQNCFWRGFVCVRGFDQKTRAPRPLMARFHYPASRLLKAKEAKAKAKANEE